MKIGNILLSHQNIDKSQKTILAQQNSYKYGKNIAITWAGVNIQIYQK